MSYKMLQHLTHVSELQFIDLMKLMQGVIIEGKDDSQVGAPPNIEQPTVICVFTIFLVSTLVHIESILAEPTFIATYEF